MPYLHRAFILKRYLNDPAAADGLLAHAEAELKTRIEAEEWPDLEDVVELARVLQLQGRFEEAWDRLVPMMEDYRTNHTPFNSPWDMHWNGYGHEFVARQVLSLGFP